MFVKYLLASDFRGKRGRGVWNLPITAGLISAHKWYIFEDGSSTMNMGFLTVIRVQSTYILLNSRERERERSLRRKREI